MRNQVLISLTAAAILLSICSHVQSRVIPHIIDLSYPYDNNTNYYPSPGNDTVKFSTKVVWKGQVESGTWYQANKFCSHEHGGTHIDAPSHFSENDWNVDDIPIERLVRKGVVFDISEKSATDPDAVLTLADVEEWERVNGQVPDGAIGLLYSGWGQYWGNITAYVGNAEDNPQFFHFPSYSIEAATFLYEHRNISGLGVDTPSVDPGNSRTFPVHVQLSPKKLFFLENVAYLDKVPAKDFMLYVMPIKLKGGSGGPTRIFAIVDEAAERSQIQERETQADEQQDTAGEPVVAEQPSATVNEETQQADEPSPSGMAASSPATASESNDDSTAQQSTPVQASMAENPHPSGSAATTTN